jgi:hypothetical protein
MVVVLASLLCFVPLLFAMWLWNKQPPPRP